MEDTGMMDRVSYGSSVSGLEPECVPFLVLSDTFHSLLCGAELITIWYGAHTFIAEIVSRNSYASIHGLTE
jgi:hypothetical protein